MSEVTEVLKALVEAAGDNLSDDIRDKVSNLDLVSNDDANARAKSERQRAERRAAKAAEDAQARIDALLDEVEGLKASGEGTKAEKAARDLERQVEKLEKANARISELETSLDSTKRDALISSVTAGINFADGISASVRDLAIREHFKDLSNDDLADATLVGETVKQFTADNAGIIASNKPSGAGTGNGSSTGGGGKITRDSIVPGEIKGEALDNAWKAAESGELV